METGLIHIYTGNGKGKTTAAVGMSVRARSRNFRTLFVQFFKERDSGSELSLLSTLGIDVLVFDQVKSPLFHPEIDKSSLREEARKAISHIRRVFTENSYDFIVLDEFICLVAEGILSAEETTDFVRNKPEGTELVLTGKGAPQELIEVADYVTFMENIKHPYKKDMKARRGIEF
ncbi:MAG: cob(I)yrinic acid a,c-diamide adenosyltransferase [Candidatus Sulfobium sp.]|jgi:cob(I)alamin adenosyltransferase